MIGIRNLEKVCLNLRVYQVQNHKIMSSSYPKNTKLNSFSPRTNFSPIDEALETSTDINQQTTHQQSHPQTINQNHHHESKFAIILIISTIFSSVCVAVLVKKSVTLPAQSSIPELVPVPVPGPISQQVPMPVKNLCLDRGYNAQYFDNLYEYLVHNKIKTVLDVGYDEQCMLEFLEKGDETLNVKYADLMDEESETEVYDWLIIEGVYTFFQQFMQQNNSLDGYVKFGVSIRQRNMEFNNNVAEKQMEQYFASIGFIYDQAKSLSLRRPQNKLIYIFLVNDTLPQTYPQPIPSLNIPDRNFLSISTILKLRQNIPYLRQWLGYHIHIGVDKFFIYDNSNASKYFYDPLVTKTQNRYGMDIRCVNFTEQQLNTEWKKIWQQFYDHIVYIKWEPKDENGNIIYGQVQAQQDYLKYFRNVVRYTAFTDTDEMIYSEQDRNVKDYILSKAKFNVTLFYLVQRHFQCRFCVKNSRVTDIEYYFNQNNGIWWGPKIIVETKYFISLSSIHQGEVSQGQKLGLPSKQLRFNHYNFELFNLGMARARNFSDSTRFQIDAGMRRYRNVMDEVCRGETCSERFQLQCPEGLQYRNCLNTEKEYPLDIQFKLTSDFVDARPSEPNKQFQYPKYKPITPPKQANISTLTPEFYQQLRQNYSCEYIVTITNQIISNSSLMLQTKYEAPLFLVFSILSKNQISLNWEGNSLKCAAFAEPEYRNAFLYQPSIRQYFILQNQRSEILTNTQTFTKQKKSDNNLFIQQQIIKDNKFLILVKQTK